MVKLIVLVKKREGMSREDFRRYWLEVHTKLSTRIPGMRGYRINVALDEQDPGAAPYDGSAEIWWDSVEAFRLGNTSPEGIVAGQDTHNFCEKVEFLFTEEYVIR
jgi:uncharacterized protein (TIGR02118 family)